MTRDDITGSLDEADPVPVPSGATAPRGWPEAASEAVRPMADAGAAHQFAVHELLTPSSMRLKAADRVLSFRQPTCPRPS
jgi:hypothetical protein